MPDMLLKNGTVVHHDNIIREDILIKEEKIHLTGQNLPCDEETHIIDCKGKHLFPGIIDAHTHMGIPIKSGYSADDFESGSISALHGGVTTIIDFTTLKKEQSLLESIKTRQQLAKKSYCDYSLHCNITRLEQSLLDEIPHVITTGINSFKVFTTYKEAGMRLAYDQIEKLAEVIAENEALLMVHAEDDEILRDALIQIENKTSNSAFLHGVSRPVEAEIKAINELGRISNSTNCKVYIVHLSSAKGLETSKKYPNIIVESCPQYLLLDDSYYNRIDGNMYVASPPLRNSGNSEELFEAAMNSQIQVLATDHCPFNISDKPQNLPFQNIPNGIGGVETLFPVMLAQIIKQKNDLKLISQLMSYNPANIFGLAQLKGSLRSGMDADVVIVDIDNIQENWADSLVSITDWNAYAGFPAIFPEYVIRRGEIFVENNKMNLGQRGKFIKAKSQ